MGGENVSYPLRGKHYVQQRGYAHHPGTGPKGETCATCRWRVKFRRWSKCGKATHKWTGGKGSDILASAMACKFWERIFQMPRATVMTEKEFLQFLQRREG